VDDRGHSKKKKKPWSKRALVDGPWDYIVIGSGMGGMTTAAMLSKLGKKVLVLEQHYVPGGFTHMFDRPGYSWDVGVHAVGEVTEHTMTGRLLAKLTDGRLEWASLGPVYDEFHFPDDFRIDFPDTPQAFRENLLRAFPREAAGIGAYFDQVAEVCSEMRRYYLSRLFPSSWARATDRVLANRARRYFESNTQAVIESLTSDRKLQTVLTSQWGYYGSLPSKSSFAMQALVTKHFQWGGYYPVGGASQIARQLLQTVADGGGWTRISTDVEEILVEGKKAIGVRLVGGEEIRASRVVSAVGVASTLTRLMPAEIRSSTWAKRIQALSPASAHVCLYMGFQGDISSAGAGSANKWFYNTWAQDQECWSVGGSDPGNAPILYCSFPSLKDPMHDPGPDRRHTGEVVTFVPWKTFERFKDLRWKRRGEEYERLKEELSASLARQFFERLPELEPMIDHLELSTPATTHHFCRPMEGSIYGLEPTPQRFETKELRPHSPIDGLYFSGSEVASVGVIGAMMGGLMACAAAEPLDAFRYIRDA
jgi:all-trans-retinol 13,14-reductase